MVVVSSQLQRRYIQFRIRRYYMPCFIHSYLCVDYVLKDFPRELRFCLSTHNKKSYSNWSKKTCIPEASSDVEEPVNTRIHAVAALSRGSRHSILHARKWSGFPIMSVKNETAVIVGVEKCSGGNEEKRREKDVKMKYNDSDQDSLSPGWWYRFTIVFRLEFFLPPLPDRRVSISNG